MCRQQVYTLRHSRLSANACKMDKGQTDTADEVAKEGSDPEVASSRYGQAGNSQAVQMTQSGQ